MISYSKGDLINMTIYDLAYEDDHAKLCSLLLKPKPVTDLAECDLNEGKNIKKI